MSLQSKNMSRLNGTMKIILSFIQKKTVFHVYIYQFFFIIFIYTSLFPLLSLLSLFFSALSLLQLIDDGHIFLHLAFCTHMMSYSHYLLQGTVSLTLWPNLPSSFSFCLSLSLSLSPDAPYQHDTTFCVLLNYFQKIKQKPKINKSLFNSHFCNLIPIEQPPFTCICSGLSILSFIFFFTIPVILFFLLTLFYYYY